MSHRGESSASEVMSHSGESVWFWLLLTMFATVSLIFFVLLLLLVRFSIVATSLEIIESFVLQACFS